MKLWCTSPNATRKSWYLKLKEANRIPFQLQTFGWEPTRSELLGKTPQAAGLRSLVSLKSPAGLHSHQLVLVLGNSATSLEHGFPLSGCSFHLSDLRKGFLATQLTVCWKEAWESMAFGRDQRADGVYRVAGGRRLVCFVCNNSWHQRGWVLTLRPFFPAS